MRKSGFSFIEIIISVIILGILLGAATIGLNKWSITSRDVGRNTDMLVLSNALKDYFYKNEEYPLPFSGVNVTANGINNIIGYQGIFGYDLMNSLSLEVRKDPLDGSYYTYYVNSDRNKFEFLAYFEQNPNYVAFEPKVYAASYDLSVRPVGVYGDRLGVLINSTTQQPIQNYTTGVDLFANTTGLNAVFSNSWIVSGTYQQLLSAMISSSNTSSKYDPSLIFYADMENTVNTGGTLYMKDFSSNGNYGSCFRVFSGAMTGTNCGNYSGLNLIQGKSSKGIFFSSGNYANFSDIPALEPTAITVCGWVNSYGTADKLTSEIIYKEDGVALKGYSLFLDQTNKIYRRVISGANYDNVYSGYDITNNRGYICGTYGSGVSKLYVNGNLINTVSSAQFNSSNNTNLSIGAANYVISPFADTFFNGIIDEVRIYNRALSNAEIFSLYNSYN